LESLNHPGDEEELAEWGKKAQHLYLHVLPLLSLSFPSLVHPCKGMQRRALPTLNRHSIAAVPMDDSYSEDFDEV